MDKQVAVSVIVPVYNAEKWLKRCVTSIAKQTLKEIEIILVDDGSSDNSGKLCDELASTDARIKVIHNSNGGPSKARNTGMRIACGEYIAFVDADDEVKLDMYETMYKTAHEENKNADIVLCNICHRSPDGERILDHHMAEKYEGNTHIRNELLKLFYTCTPSGIVSPCNKLYRRVFLQECCIEFDEQRVRAEDYHFNFRAIRDAALIRTIKGPYYIYYQDNLNSITHTYRENHYFEWKIGWVRDRKDLIKQLQQVSIEIDYSEFWRPLVYKTYMYILKTIGKDKNCKDKIMQIIKDDTLHQAVSCKCKSYTIPMKTLNWLIKMKLYNTAWISFVAIEKIKRYS